MEATSNSYSNDSFFSSLDAPLRNIESSAEPILFQTRDHLVQYKFELPVPTLPGSTVKYCKSM